jgi:hypothetical protein
MNDHQEELAEEIQRILSEYKRTEHNKIVQIFHVTVLIILGFYNLKIDKNSYEAVYLLISLSCIAGAYLFWYLADIINLKLEVNIQELLHNNYEMNSSDSEHLYNKYINNFQNSIIIQISCFLSALASHIFIFIAAIYFFNLKDNYSVYLPVFFLFGFGTLQFYNISIAPSRSHIKTVQEKILRK